MTTSGVRRVRQYIFDEHEDDRELARLRLIEQALDEGSFAHLQSTGIDEGWRCLEVGAGGEHLEP